jgi:hypothetical protein
MAVDRKSGSGKPSVHQRLVAIVERQIAAGEPKEVGGTLIRLSFLGISRDEAVRMIAYIWALEMREMMTSGRGHDERAYVAKLHLLPDLARITPPDRGAG